MERDAELAEAVERAWSRTSPPSVRLAADVWGLVRDASLLQRVCDGLPAGALLLVIAGSPCQRLTYCGAGGGGLGLCGLDSVAFHVVPVVCYGLQRLRPDLTIHAVVENAGSVRPVFLDAIGRASAFRTFGAKRPSSTQCNGPALNGGATSSRRFQQATVRRRSGAQHRGSADGTSSDLAPWRP